MPDPIQLIDPKTGKVYEADDEAMAQRQMHAFGLDRAAPDQVQAYDEQQRSTGLVDKALAVPAVIAGQASELVEAANKRGLFQPQDPLSGAPIGRGAIDPQTGKLYPGVAVEAETVAPFAYTPQMRERVRANPNTALAATIGTDIATAALIPGLGAGGAVLSSAVSGLLTEAGTTYIDDDEYSIKDAALAAGAALAFEGVGALAIKGAMKAKGIASNYLDSAVMRARKAAATGAEAETDAVRAAEQLRRNSEELYTKHQTTLDDALGAIDERTAGAPERMFTPGALKKSVSANIGAQEEAFLDMAVKFDQASQVAEVPGLADVTETIQGALGKNGAGMFDAMRTARRQLDALGAVDNPLVREAAEALDSTLRSEPTWGKAAKNYADIADDVGGAADTVSVNLREANAREVLDQRLDRARRMASLTNDQKLKGAIKTAEDALEGADKVTGARLMAETTPDEIAKLQKKVDGFQKRAPKLGKELHETYSRLNKTLDNVLGEMTEDAALDYVAARASGVGGKVDPLRDLLVKAEKKIADMKMKGTDPTKIARATSAMKDLREAIGEVHDIPRATQRIRDWEAKPQPGKGLLGKIAGKVGGAADDVVVDEIQNAIQPMLHGAGMTIGLHVGGIPGAAVGYLGGRAINKAFGERIARWVWKRSKQGAVEFAKKNPLEAVGAAVGGVGGAYLGPKGIVGGAIAGRNAARKVTTGAQSLSRKIWRQTEKTVAEEGEQRAARSVGAAAADPKRGPIGEAVRDAYIRADEALEELEKLGASGVKATKETAAQAWEVTKTAAKSAEKAVTDAAPDVAGAATQAAQRARHVAGDAVSAVVDAAQKAGAKAPEIAAAARQAAQRAGVAASDVAKAATGAAKRAGAKAADVARAATESAASAAEKVGTIGRAAQGVWDAAEHVARAAATTAQDVAKAAQRAALKSTATARGVASATAAAARRATAAANNVARAAARSVKGVGSAVTEGFEQAVAKARAEITAWQTRRAAEKELAAKTFQGEPVKVWPKHARQAAQARESMTEFQRQILDRALTEKPNGQTPLDALNGRLRAAPMIVGKPRFLDPGTRKVHEALTGIVKEARQTGNVVHGEFYQPAVMSHNMIAILEVHSKNQALGLAAGFAPPTLRTKEFIKGSSDMRDAFVSAHGLKKELRGHKSIAPVIMRINSRGAVPVSEVEALITTPGARLWVKKVTKPKTPADFYEIHLEDISLSAQRRQATGAKKDLFTGEGIRKAKGATVAVDQAERVPLAGRLLGDGPARKVLNDAIDAAKKDPGKALGVAGLVGAGALAGDDQNEGAAAAASVGFLSFFLPRGGKRLLGETLDEAFGQLTAKSKLHVRQVSEMVAKENEGLLRSFATKKSAFKDAAEVIDEQYANAQRLYAKQHRINLDIDNTIPEDVLTALEADIRFRNAAVIESDPELHRLAQIGKFDVIKGGGEGVKGVPELRKFGLPEPGQTKVSFEDFPPTITATITPERAVEIRAARYNLAAESLHEGDLPQDVAQLLIDRRERMVEEMPSKLGEGQMFGYVENQLLGFEQAAKHKLGRELNEREKELAEAAFYYHATPRHNELTRLDEALAKDDTRIANYREALGDVPDGQTPEHDAYHVMKELDDEQQTEWQNVANEVEGDLLEEKGLSRDGERGLSEGGIDEAVARIKETHIVDPADEIFIRKHLGQEPPDMREIDDWIDDAVSTTAGYHDYGTDSPDLDADDIIRQIENGDTRAGNHTLTPWEEYHVRERFDEDAGSHQQRFDELVEEHNDYRAAEDERAAADDAKRRGLKHSPNEDKEGARDPDIDDGLPKEWALNNIGLGNVRVHDHAGVENVFGGDPVTLRELRGMFALDELKQFAKAEGSELKTVLEVTNDTVFFNGSAGGGAFDIRAEINRAYKATQPTVATYSVVRVPEGSGFTKEGVIERIREALAQRDITKVAGLGAGALAIGAGAKALHDQAQEARDEVRAHRQGQANEDDLHAALDKIEGVERTREKLGYLKTESELISRDAARAIANPNPRERVVATVPGVTGSQGIARFLGSHATLQEAYDDKRETFKKLQTNPMLLVDELAEGLGEVQEHAPGLHGKMVQQSYKVVQYLQGKLPSTIGASLTRPDGSPPNALAVRQFALYFSAATDPSSVMGDLANNRARKEQIDTLREVWPDVYQDLKIKVVDQLSQGRPTVAQRNRLDLLFDLGESLDRGLSPRLVQSLAQYRAQQAAPDGGAPGAGKQAPSRRTQPSVTGTGALPSLNLGPAAGPGTLA